MHRNRQIRLNRMIDIMDINRWIRIEQIDELHNEIDGYEWIETDGYE